MKTITYGTMHFVVAFSVTYVMTGSLAIAGGIAMVEPLIQTFAYNIHEKIWEKIKKKNIQKWNEEIKQPIVIS